MCDLKEKCGKSAKYKSQPLKQNCRLHQQQLRESDDTHSPLNSDTSTADHERPCDGRDETRQHPHSHHFHHKSTNWRASHTRASLSSSSGSSSPSLYSSSSSSSSFSSSSSSSVFSDSSSEGWGGRAYRKPQHSRSCNDISQKNRFFEEEDDDDTAPLIERRGENRSSAQQRRENIKSPQGTRNRTQTIVSTNDGNVRKSKSMEALTQQRHRDRNGNEDQHEQETKKTEARKNLVKEKMKFSAFLNEITRQVLSPMRLTTLGVTDAQRYRGPGQTSAMSRETGRRPRIRSTSADSLSSRNQPSALNSNLKTCHYSADVHTHMHHRPRSCTDISCLKTPETHQQHHGSPSHKNYHHHHHCHHEDHRSHEHRRQQRRDHSPTRHSSNHRSAFQSSRGHHKPSHHHHHGHHRHGDHHCGSNRLRDHHHNGHGAQCHGNRHHHGDNRHGEHHHRGDDHHGNPHFGENRQVDQHHENQHQGDHHSLTKHHEEHHDRHHGDRFGRAAHHEYDHVKTHHENDPHNTHHHGDRSSCHHGDHSSGRHSHPAPLHHPGNRHGSTNLHHRGEGEHRHHGDHLSGDHQRRRGGRQSPGYQHHHADHAGKMHNCHHGNNHDESHPCHHGDYHIASHQHHYEYIEYNTSHHRGTHGSKSHPATNDTDNEDRDLEQKDHVDPFPHFQTSPTPSPSSHGTLETRTNKADTAENLSRQEVERTSFMNSSSHNEKTPEMGKITLLQEKNEGLHHSLLQTAVRMECLGEEFMSSQKLLEAELQVTRVELSSLTERFRRLHDSCSSTQQTNHLLQKQLHSVTQSLEEERERLNRRISELTEQLTGANFANSAETETFSATSILPNTNFHFHSDDAINQQLLSIPPPPPPPPAQSTDTYDYEKAVVIGPEQSLRSVPEEEEESDWSELGEEIPRFILARSAHRNPPWTHQEFDTDKDSESGGEEMFRLHSAHTHLQLPHLHFTFQSEMLPALQTDACTSALRTLCEGVTGEGHYKMIQNLNSSILARSASLEEIPLTRPHMQNELRGTKAMMDLHLPGAEVMEDSDNEIIHHWRTSGSAEAANERSIEGSASEAESGLVGLRSAERMLNHFICETQSGEGKGGGRAEAVHGWTGRIPDEVLKGEQTKL